MTHAKHSTRILLSTLAAGLVVACTPPAMAQSTKGASGLPLPRYVSLKARSVNLRVGPGTDYAVSWRFQKDGLPVEIIQEYDNWRRVRDADGTEGWINQSLLSGERTAMAAPWMKSNGKDVYVNMRRDSLDSSSIVAKLQPGVVMRLDECTGNWCKAEAGGVEGWVVQAEIWGAYPGEAFK
ncbi:SH3 domain-containing protein [Rhizobium halophytocola]|uniref:SH3-like domain-containing protein n=1 Tax=Rhizobium halophytocola TaxID=735519 RepID=A0ABS4E147_9HYPH|nr:SH3 domain-containing protein [Rhizobium halophytocola]MBP1851665.1 SH3-like domain-containing protein [Rhizobium halophytocola]